MRICILGAGASGIILAYYLSKICHDPLVFAPTYGKHNTLEIILIEGRSRLGGRTFTASVPIQHQNQTKMIPIETGAEFIHGEHTSTHAYLDIFLGAKGIPFERSSQMMLEEQGRAVHRDGIKDVNRLREMIHAFDTIDQINWTKYGDMSLSEYFKLRGFTQTEIDLADVLFAQTCCANCSELSVRDLVREKLVDRAGEKEFRIPGGYTSLLDAVVNQLEKHSHVQIMKDTTVEVIDYSHDNFISIQCNNLKTIQADKCVVTFPVSVIKSKIHFVPALPQQKQLALKHFQSQAATKLIYIFDQPVFSFNYLITSKHARWWSNQFTPSGFDTPVQVITNYLTSAYAEQADNADEDTILSSHLSFLCHLFEKDLATLNQHLMLKTRISWKKEALSLGGYAAITPHNQVPEPRLSVEQNPRESLAMPLQNRIFFAGEATNTHSNFQTVHGAFDSAARCFQEILAVHQSSKL